MQKIVFEVDIEHQDFPALCIRQKGNFVIDGQNVSFSPDLEVWITRKKNFDPQTATPQEVELYFAAACVIASSGTRYVIPYTAEQIQDCATVGEFVQLANGWLFMPDEHCLIAGGRRVEIDRRYSLVHATAAPRLTIASRKTPRQNQLRYTN